MSERYENSTDRIENPHRCEGKRNPLRSRKKQDERKKDDDKSSKDEKLVDIRDGYVGKDDVFHVIACPYGRIQPCKKTDNGAYDKYGT